MIFIRFLIKLNIEILYSQKYGYREYIFMIFIRFLIKLNIEILHSQNIDTESNIDCTNQILTKI